MVNMSNIVVNSRDNLHFFWYFKYTRWKFESLKVMVV